MEAVIAEAVIAKAVITEAVIAKTVIAKTVIAKTVIAKAVIVKAVIAEAVKDLSSSCSNTFRWPWWITCPALNLTNWCVWTQLDPANMDQLIPKQLL